jgi:glucan 1,3-beta-glucosidase
VQVTFPDKPILIGETGWPSAGRQRGNALPSRINEARFVRSFLAYASRSGVPYNLVEAYDQPWKRRLEGTAGGNWGLYDIDGNLKFPLQGPVTEDSDWYVGPLGGIALALMLGFMTWRACHYSDRWALSAVVLTGYIGGAILVAEYEQLASANRGAFEWVLTASGALLELLTICVLAQAFGRRLTTTDTPLRNRGTWFDWLTRCSGHADISNPALLRFIWLFGAAVVNLLLVFDPRYRDFPIALFLPAASGLAALSLDRESRLARITLEAQILAGWAGSSAVLIVIMEGVSNRDAIFWAILCIGLGVSVWVPALRPCKDQHAHRESDRTRLEAVPNEAGSADCRSQPRQER